MSARPLDPHGPDYGTTELQGRMLVRYLPSTQRSPMDWPTCSREGTSVRALVRRRLISRSGDGRLFISDKGRTAHALRTGATPPRS
jgi:hypothetical protein